jgi:hypothetical protein
LGNTDDADVEGVGLMKIIYNGISIEIVKVQEISRQSVYDDSGTDYLYTKWSINVTGLIEGKAALAAIGMGGMTWTNTNTPPIGLLSPVVPVTPLAASGPLPISPAATIAAPAGLANAPNRPIKTDAAIRHSLSIPRRMLQIVSDAVAAGAPAEILLQSPPISLPPATNAVCDCKNGPHPIAVVVDSVFGDANMFGVTFQVETYVNEDTFNGRLPTVLLSNRFSCRHDINENSFMTRYVNGVAIFRADYTWPGGPNPAVNPDSLRGAMMLPIPLGCERNDMKTESSRDGLQVTYSFTDVHKHGHFVGGTLCGAARITASHEQTVTNDQDLWRTVKGAYNEVLNWRFLQDSHKDRIAAEGILKEEKAVRKSAVMANRAKARYYKSRIVPKVP